MAEFEWRLAAAGEVPAIVELVESAYRGESSKAGWTHEADLLAGRRTDTESVAALLSGPDSVILVAGQRNELVACCHLERHDTYAYFGMFAVRPLLQGSGIGKQMIAAAEDYARREWNISEMRMTVISRREELIAWYERRGYKRTGTMSPFPYGDERFGIPKFADLEFELLVKRF